MTMEHWVEGLIAVFYWIAMFMVVPFFYIPIAWCIQAKKSTKELRKKNNFVLWLIVFIIVEVFLITFLIVMNSAFVDI